MEERDVSSIEWHEVEPESPFYLFIPRDKGLWEEYQQGWRLPDVFPVNVLGFQTHRDHFAIAFTREEMAQSVADMHNSITSDNELRQKYNLKDNHDWNLSEARKQVRLTKADDVIRDCLYRPFDVRPSYFSYEAMDYPRRELMDHVAGKANLCHCMYILPVPKHKAICWRQRKNNPILRRRSSRCCLNDWDCHSNPPPIAGFIPALPLRSPRSLR